MAVNYRNKYSKPAQGGPVQAVNRAGGEWCGYVNVTSAANNFQTISCAVLTTSDAVFLTTRVLGVETVDFPGYVVTSLNSGVNFQVGPVASRGALVASYQIHWQVVKLA